MFVVQVIKNALLNVNAIIAPINNQNLLLLNHQVMIILDAIVEDKS